jgi:type I restriction enzyme S subunit
MNVPRRWTVAEFSDLTNMLAVRPSGMAASGPVRCVELEHVEPETGRLLAWRDGDSELSSKVAFSAGQVLFGKLRPYLRKSWLATFSGICTSEMWVLEAVAEKCDTRYLHQLTLSSRFAAATHASSGSKMPRADWSFVSEFPFPVPPVGEQRKIADVLECWDRAIDRLVGLLLGKAEHRRGIMQQLLTGRLRFKEFRGEPWRAARVGALLEECDRYVRWSDDKAYRFASIRRRSGGLFDRGTFYGREVKTKVLKLLKAGDFVISKRQVVHGAWAMVTKPFDGFGVSDEYDVLVNRDPKALDMRFFNYLSQTRRLWHMAFLASNGVHIEKLIFDFDDFAKEKVRIPPTVEEQARIVGVLSACDREIELLQKQLDAVKEQKRGLMQKLLTGEMRVKC